VQHDYAEYQRELVAAAAPLPAALPAGAPTLMTGLPPQSKSTSDLPNSSDTVVVSFRWTVDTMCVGGLREV